MHLIIIGYYGSKTPVNIKNIFELYSSMKQSIKKELLGVPYTREVVPLSKKIQI